LAPYKIVVVGCGGMSEAWIRYAVERQKKLGDVEVVALVDLRREAAEAKARAFELTVPCFSDLGEALRATTADLVFDISIPESHKAVALRAFSHGCSVFGEKPMASSLADAQEMVAAAQKAGVRYSVMQNRRYLSGIRAYRQLVVDHLGPVGIINADTSLHLPDFRAGERTFQLLTQVAGRAGRGEREGEVMIQTYTPVSPSIQFARHHDYHGFFEQELVLRKQFAYPPFQKMILVQLRGKIQARVASFASALREQLHRALPADTKLGEAVPAPLERAYGQYRFHIAIRGGSVKKMRTVLQTVLKKNPSPSGLITTIDVDPQSLS
jgi:hypothetical protein